MVFSKNNLAKSEKIVVIIPVFNESNVIKIFLMSLFCALSKIDNNYTIIVVNDGSTDDTSEILKEISVQEINIDFISLNLRYNIGQQNAIYIGLVYCYENLNSDKFIVMDGDGEDNPEGISQILNVDDCDAVLVERGKRSEDILFRFFHRFYGIIFYLFTKKKITHGNYSMINNKTCRILVENGFVHYASFLEKIQITKKKIIIDRAPRINGKSKVGFNGLFIHAIKSFIEFKEVVLLTILKYFSFLIVGGIIIALSIIALKIFTSLPIPGWSSIILSITFNIIISSLIVFLIGINMLSKNEIHPFVKKYSMIEASCLSRK